MLLQVKVVRETMNLTLDMWKEVTNVSEDVPALVKSACASVGKVLYPCWDSFTISVTVPVWLNLDLDLRMFMI